MIHEPGRGYRTVVHISGRQPIAGDYPEGQWSAAKADLEEALRQHGCDVFTINAPIWTEIGLSRIAQLDQRTAPRGPMSALGGSGRAAPKEEVRG